MNDNISIFIEGSNIFNTGYESLKGIKGDGRWYRCGVTLHF